MPPLEHRLRLLPPRNRADRPLAGCEYSLKLLDLHASVGPEKNWFSANEWERQAGVELVKNRLEMTARLGGDAVVMHYPKEPDNEPVRRSLDELEGFARQTGVRIALENGSFDAVEPLAGQVFPGLCRPMLRLRPRQPDPGRPGSPRPGQGSAARRSPARQRRHVRSAQSYVQRHGRLAPTGAHPGAFRL